MKRYIPHILAVVGILALWACSDDIAADLEPVYPDAKIRITDESIGLDIEPDGKKAEGYFSSMGGIVIVKVESDRKDWDYVIEGDWLQVDRMPDGLVLNVVENESDESLTAHIVLRAAPGVTDADFAEVVITQRRKGGDNLLTSTDQVILTAGGQYPGTVEIITDCEEWSYEVKSTWLLAERDENKLILTAKPNAELNERRVDLTVSAVIGGDKISEKVMVFQEAKAFITAEPVKTFSYYDDGGATTFTIKTNQRVWDVEVPDSDWIDVVTNDDFTVDLTIHPNTGAENRKYSIYLTSGRLDNTDEEEITVTQTGNDRSMMVFEYDVFADESGKLGEVILPFHSIVAGAVMDCVVDWGDGTSEHYTEWLPKHQYAHEGTFHVSVRGSMPAINTGAVGRPHADYIKRVKRWGKTGLVDMTGALQYTRGMVEIPPDTDGSFSQVTTFEKAFFCAYYLEEIPAGLFSYATKATNFESVFAGAKSYKEIPAGLFDKCTAMENVSSAFYSHNGTGDITEAALEKVPAGLFKNCTKVTKANGIFDGHAKITQIPADILAYFPDITDLQNTFSGTGVTDIPSGLLDNCTKLKLANGLFSRTKVSAIPSGFFDACPDLTHANNIFSYCENLRSIPANMFANCPELIEVMGAFSYCSGLQSIPAGLFDNNPKLYTFSGTFRGTGINEIPAGLFDNVMPLTTTSNTFANTFNGCTNLEILPAELFKECSNAKTYSGCFEGCSSIREIPTGNFFNGISTTNINIANIFAGCTSLRKVGGNLFDLLRLTSFSGLFKDCESLEEVDKDLFAGKPDVTNFSNVFQNCKSLITVPKELFEKNTKVTNFSGAFYGCRNLASVPAELFSANVAVTNFQNVFRGCLRLSTVPAGLFANNTKATNFSYSFNGSGITTIPQGLFSSQAALALNLSYAFGGCAKLEEVTSGVFGNLKATNFSYMFQNSTALRTVAADIFAGCSGNNINFSYLFDGCTALETVPAVFKGLSTAQNVSYAFRGSGLKSAPADLFQGCSNINNVSYLFQNCRQFTTVPGGMFTGTKPNNFNYLFNGCTALETVPADVFNGVTSNPNVFLQTFAGCTALKSVPASVFDNFTKANSFSNTFNGCTALTGESPYTIIEGVKVHLYERENYASVFTRPNLTSNCFTGCAGLSDYANIPDNWK